MPDYPECRICGRTIKSKGPLPAIQHGKTHRREFADQTGLSENINYELIVAYYRPENAREYAKEAIMQAKIDGDITTLENWDEDLIEEFKEKTRDYQGTLEAFIP